MARREQLLDTEVEWFNVEERLKVLRGRLDPNWIMVFDRPNIENCDAAFEHIQAAGGEVLQEPIDQPYGVRDCAFRDPSRNMIRFTQPSSVTAGSRD